MNRFLTRIELFDFFKVGNMSIPLSEEKPQHLIITGKNGSGKTQLVGIIGRNIIGAVSDAMTLARPILSSKNTIEYLKNSDKPSFTSRVESDKGVLLEFNGIEGDDHAVFQEIFCVFLDSKRNSNIKNPKVIDKAYGGYYGGTGSAIDDKLEDKFLSYLVNIAAERAFAKEYGDTELADKIDYYFTRLEKGFGNILGLKNLKLVFDREVFNFKIVSDNADTFYFDKLPDGFSAIVTIISEIILRTSSHKSNNFHRHGIVIIDEIETHLHISLQKDILPFLIDFFPNIQFIVTTHSPFVMTSVANATVCDLEKKIVTNDLSNYSYEAIIESYFELDKYSQLLKNRVSEYELLLFKNDINENEEERLKYLKDYLDNIPKYLSSELVAKLQEIKIKQLTTHKK